MAPGPIASSVVAPPPHSKPLAPLPGASHIHPLRLCRSVSVQELPHTESLAAETCVRAGVAAGKTDWRVRLGRRSATSSTYTDCSSHGPGSSPAPFLMVSGEPMVVGTAPSALGTTLSNASSPYVTAKSASNAVSRLGQKWGFGKEPAMWRYTGSCAAASKSISMQLHRLGKVRGQCVRARPHLANGSRRRQPPGRAADAGLLRRTALDAERTQPVFSAAGTVRGGAGRSGGGQAAWRPRRRAHREARVGRPATAEPEQGSGDTDVGEWLGLVDGGQ